MLRHAMLKSLYSRHNDVFLDMLRNRRKSLRLRQRDLARLVGRGQATVSKVEAGSRRLDVIELRTWLGVLQVDFVDFIDELEQRLRHHSDVDMHLLMGGPIGTLPETNNSGNPCGRTRSS